MRDFNDDTPLEQAKRVLVNSDYWLYVTSAIKKSLPKHHWQSIVDKLS